MKTKQNLLFMAFLAMITLLPINAYAQENLGMPASRYYENAKNGDPEAQYELALCYLNGLGVEVDYAEAFELALKSAQQSFPLGTALVGDILENGLGREKNTKNAHTIHGKVVSQSMPLISDVDLAVEVLTEALQVIEDQAAYVYNKTWRQSRNDNTDPRALYALYYIFINGKGVPTNENEAFKLLRLSAKSGYAKAQNTLGLYYAESNDEESQNTAVQLFNNAAEQGNEDAMWNLACAYKEGKGVKKDISKANYWLQKAAENGQPEAIEALSNE